MSWGSRLCGLGIALDKTYILMKRVREKLNAVGGIPVRLCQSWGILGNFAYPKSSLADTTQTSGPYCRLPCGGLLLQSKHDKIWSLKFVSISVVREDCPNVTSSILEAGGCSSGMRSSDVNVTHESGNRSLARSGQQR